MNDPRVAAVMLAADRPEMTARAIQSFSQQSYGNAFLYILDNGEVPIVESLPEGFPEMRITYHRSERAGRKIGGLRNYANGWAIGDGAEIICHFDSDDVSHPLRIEEQVALLQSSGAEVVGYSDMLFWRAEAVHGIGQEYYGQPVAHGGLEYRSGEAWLYRNNDRRYCLGTSLCYWRKTWEAKPFHSHRPERRGATGEEFYWLQELRRSAVSSLGGAPVNAPMSVDRTKDLSLGPNMGYGIAPRMVASIHSSNTQDYSGIDKNRNSWTRVPAWDAYCREKMAL